MTARITTKVVMTTTTTMMLTTTTIATTTTMTTAVGALAMLSMKAIRRVNSFKTLYGGGPQLLGQTFSQFCGPPTPPSK